MSEQILKLSRQWNVPASSVHYGWRNDGSMFYWSDMDPHLVWWDSTHLATAMH